MLNNTIILTFVSAMSACKMTVQPRLCFTCSYLTLFGDGSPLNLVSIKRACQGIEEKCCMKKRSFEVLQSPKSGPWSRETVGSQISSNSSATEKNDMLSRRFLIRSDWNSNLFVLLIRKRVFWKPSRNVNANFCSGG